MKPTPGQIAQALVELCRELPPDEVGNACDGSLSLLETHGLSHALRTFPRLVRHAALARENAVPVTMTSPTGSLGAAGQTLVSTLERTLARIVEWEETADAGLIGGVVLRSADDRFDASLRSALDQLALSLTQPLPLRP
ncbi:MAG: hypothetical protein Greene041619_548 [Candidatus Peregrinibacteria bacterium Greene0416_19]|nr:MAG: hypothetical protein Greene041619_548 [Candidatus Peregrinibacteria bacterium Greene0416_19]